jgi:hypothetical protein
MALWSDICAFCRAAKDRWRQMVGGGAIFIVFGTAASIGFHVPWWISFIAAFCLAVAVACFLVWREEHENVVVLTNRMKSRIRISCGKSVPQSVVPAGGEVWYRARLDLDGVVPVPDIEAAITELWQDGERVALPETLILTMYPGMTSAYPVDTNLKTLREGKPEFVDVIRTHVAGGAFFPLKFYPRAVAHDELLHPGHTYTIIVAVCSTSNRTDICKFEFNWTGDPQTSDIRLISVKPPLLSDRPEGK